MMRRGRLVLALAMAGAMGLACGTAALQRRADEVSAQLAEARARGAAACAAEALATGEAHHAQAVADLGVGNTCGAEDELAHAERQAQAALAASTPEVCAAAIAPAVPAGDRDGDGIADDADACPDAAEDKDGYVDLDGCPDPDDDGDGILDGDDACPRQPEDLDGRDDADGCPDLDDDGDGIPDVDDRCPLDPEDLDGFKDDDGCPDCDDDFDGVPECPEALDLCPGQPGLPPDGCGQRYQLITITEVKIELKQTVYFATNKATIQKKSFPLLAEVAQALADRPSLRVRIEGHTDSRGKDAANMVLSQRRAEAVRDHLVAAGIDGERLVAQGFGETVPLADNRTTAGRDTNRRVEFMITAQ
ncbi:MAG: OmpA family protein [Kofleriaceae bacterium]